MTCLAPAFFIAGAIMVFLNQQSAIMYLGPKTKKIAAYSVASVFGAILAVCSCTVLPLFKGIYRKGAGLGPAVSLSLFRAGHQSLIPESWVASLIGETLSSPISSPPLPVL